MIRTVFVSVLLLATGGTAEAQWRSIRMTDDATGQPMVLAQAEGSHGRLRVLVDCREGFHVLAIGFTGDTVFADGTVRLVWGDGPGAEQHYWEPDDDYEVLYLTTWGGGRGAGAGYDRQAAAFFENLRRHTHFWVRVTPRGAGPVTEHFGLAGAAGALDALNCRLR